VHGTCVGWCAGFPGDAGTADSCGGATPCPHRPGGGGAWGDQVPHASRHRWPSAGATPARHAAAQGATASEERTGTFSTAGDGRAAAPAAAPERFGLTGPCFAPAACGWARALGRSIQCHGPASWPAALACCVRVSTRRRKTPACGQRSKRLATVRHGPERSGRSRQGAPGRSRHQLPLRRRRGSTAGRPILGG